MLGVLGEELSVAPPRNPRQRAATRRRAREADAGALRVRGGHPVLHGAGVVVHLDGLGWD